MRESREPSPAEVSELIACDASRYDELLAAKVERVKSKVREAMDCDPAAPEVHASPKSHYRQRTNFRVIVEERARYVMFSPKATKQPLRVAEFPRASLAINEMMPVVLSALNAEPLLRRSVFEVRFHTTRKAGALVLLCYNRAIDGAWLEPAERLLARLPDGAIVVGRSRKVKLVVGSERACVLETMRFGGREYYYEQLEGEFSQPNGDVCEKMLSWSARVTRGSDLRDLLELYCGNGNFTVALAQNFRRVLATELSKTNTIAARGNVARNGIENVKVARLTSAEMGIALSPTGRDFNRLNEAGVALSEYDLGTLFVDPPRAGLDRETLELAAGFDRLVYVSCNPDTFAQDLAYLRKTHHLTHLAVFDQFPYTDHIEVGAVCEKRQVPLDIPLVQKPPALKRGGAESPTKKKKPPKKKNKIKTTTTQAAPAKRQRLGCSVM